MARGVSAPVQLMVDASDANTAKLVSAYSGEVTNAYNLRTAAAIHPALVQTAFRLWYNPGLSSKKFYGPGIFVLGLSMFPPLLAALAMAKEGEQKTILQVYVSSISAHEFLLGKILAFTAVALAESAVMLIILFTYFGLMAGDPTPFFIATILYAFCVAAFGTMVGRRSESGRGIAGGFARRFSASVFALRAFISNSKYSRWDPLDFQHHLGPLLH